MAAYHRLCGTSQVHAFEKEEEDYKLMIAEFGCTNLQHEVVPKHNLLPYVTASTFSHATTQIIQSSEASIEAVLPHCNRTQLPLRSCCCDCY